MKKTEGSDPTQDKDLTMETQTVTASGNEATVTFDESYSSVPTLVATAKTSPGFDVGIDSISTTSATLHAESDADIDVLVIGIGS